MYHLNLWPTEGVLENFYQRIMSMVHMREDNHIWGAKLLKLVIGGRRFDLNIWVSQYEFTKRWIECEPINSFSSTKNKLYIKSKGVTKNSSCKTIVFIFNFIKNIMYIPCKSFHTYSSLQLPYSSQAARRLLSLGQLRHWLHKSQRSERKRITKLINKISCLQQIVLWH